MPKWIDRDDLDPIDGGPRGSVNELIEELRTQPGRWAEIARYPLVRIGSARSRGANMRKRHPEVQYAVRQEEDEVILYFRMRPL